MEKTIVGIRTAAQKRAQVVFLQELFTSLYFCDVEDYENLKLEEAIPGSVDGYFFAKVCFFTNRESESFSII